LGELESVRELKRHGHHSHVPNTQKLNGLSLHVRVDHPEVRLTAVVGQANKVALTDKQQHGLVPGGTYDRADVDLMLERTGAKTM
jgi:hypothetical protein